MSVQGHSAGVVGLNLVCVLDVYNLSVHIKNPFFEVGWLGRAEHFSFRDDCRWNVLPGGVDEI